jgi:hypothetical protein
MHQASTIVTIWYIMELMAEHKTPKAGEQRFKEALAFRYKETFDKEMPAHLKNQETCESCGKDVPKLEKNGFCIDCQDAQRL